jgi:hypothetical protein
LNYANESSSRERACLPRRLCIVAAPAIPAVKEKKKKRENEMKKKKPEMKKNKIHRDLAPAVVARSFATVKWLN